MKERSIANNQSNLPRTNSDIRVAKVRLIDAEGQMIGVVDIDRALSMAEAQGLDLVEVSPNADPPVCKILDYGKYKYMMQKKAHDAKRKQKVVELKELRIRPTIGEHDYQIKIKQATKFLGAGNKVKISLRYKGREITHQEVGMAIFERIQKDLEGIAKVEMIPKMEGKQLTMVVAPAVSAEVKEKKES